MGPKPVLTDDCFAKLDAALESLSAELEGNLETSVRPASPSATLRIVSPADPEARAPRYTAGYGQPLDEYLEAFDLLDQQLAARSAPVDQAPLDVTPVHETAHVPDPAPVQPQSPAQEVSYGETSPGPTSSDPESDRVAAPAPVAAALSASGDRAVTGTSQGRDRAGTGTCQSPSGPAVVAAELPPAAAAAAPPPAPVTLAAPVALVTPVAPATTIAPDPGGDFWRPRADGGTPVERLMGGLQNLSLIQRRLSDRNRRGTADITYEDIVQVFNDLRKLCVEFHLQSAGIRAEFALAVLENDQIDALSGEIVELVRHVRHDLQTCSIYPIPKDRLWSFSLALDSRTQAAFPSAQAEMAEGGKCYGFGRYAASVFHMLRCAEYGLRALERAAASKGAPVGSARDIDAVIAILECRVAEIDGWPASPAKDRAVEFFQGALIDVRRLRDGQRKLAVGSKIAWDEHQAQVVYHACQALLARLATKLTEGQDRPLVKRDFSF